MIYLTKDGGDERCECLWTEKPHLIKYDGIWIWVIKESKPLFGATVLPKGTIKKIVGYTPTYKHEPIELERVYD